MRNRAPAGCDSISKRPNRGLRFTQLLGGFVIKVSATEDRAGVQVVASDSEGGSFFESAINVYDAMNASCDGESILGLFLSSMVDYIVDREAEWVAGDEEGCEQQDRAIAACVAAMQLLRQNVFRDNAIKKATEFIDASKST